MTSTHVTTALALGAVAGLMLAAASPRTAHAKPCGWGDCGSNTADLRGTAINGLNVNGVSNIERVRLVPGSLTLFPSFARGCLGRSGGGYSIAVVNGALVGTTSPFGEIVPAVCLANATFQLDVPIATESGTYVTKRVTLKIAQRSSVSTWQVDPSARAVLPTYQLIDVEQGRSICPTNGTWQDTFHDTLIPTMPPGVVGMDWYRPTDHAVIVQGETYDATVTIDTSRSTAAWFNIACAGSAIAKARMMGYDPMTSTTTAAARQATLKMLTAHYVSGSAQSWTVTGMPLVWAPNPGVEYYRTPTNLVRGPTEAFWDANGAICLSHLRAARVGTTLDEVRELASIRALEELPTCGTAAPPGWLWRTFTVDHVD